MFVCVFMGIVQGCGCMMVALLLCIAHVPTLCTLYTHHSPPSLHPPLIHAHHSHTHTPNPSPPQTDNWDDQSTTFIRRWIEQHTADGTPLDKPVLLQEFGAFPAQRARVYDDILDSVEVLVERGTPLKGAGMWQLFLEGQVGPLSEGGAGGMWRLGETRGGGTWGGGWARRVVASRDTHHHHHHCFLLAAEYTETPPPQTHSHPHLPTHTYPPTPHPGKYGVFPTEPAWQRMRAFATRINTLGGTVRACAAPTHAPVAAPPACPAGKEGPLCETDVNECARGTDTCPTNAACSDRVGGYNCTCYPGYALRGGACQRDECAVEVRVDGGCVVPPTVLSTQALEWKSRHALPYT